EARSDGEGRGSTFFLRIPLVETCEEASAAPPKPETGREVQPRRILVVDDNVDSADSLSMLLSASGHTVTKAYTGQGGIDAAISNPPDLAILDIGLPDMTGFDLAHRLRGE